MTNSMCTSFFVVAILLVGCANPSTGSSSSQTRSGSTVYAGSIVKNGLGGSVLRNWLEGTWTAALTNSLSSSMYAKVNSLLV